MASPRARSTFDSTSPAGKRKRAKDATAQARGLWTCPKCGQSFVTANIWHSCVNVPLDAHFEGKPPHLRKMFDALVAMAERNGRVALRSVRSRIAIQAYSRFASVTVQKSSLMCHVILDHANARDPIRRVEKIGNAYLHQFKLAAIADVDARIGALIDEAYAIDSRHHGHRAR